MFKIRFALLYLPYVLCAKQIDTFYGPIEVQEPVLLELIESPPIQRLKHIHQYGVAYYTTHKEEYTRYDHSIGVFTILRVKGASLEEQIAGLLHDVSHTVFSHVGDWVFGKENQEKDYQNGIHATFLKKSGLGDILKKHSFTIDQVLPLEELFPALENLLPNLCADRIDYNIQGAYHRGFITYEEAKGIFEDIRFTGKRWVSTQPKLMKKLVLFSLFMTEDCWGGPVNHLSSRWLADALLRGIDLGCLSYKELHFGTDQVVWNKLMAHKDPIIREKMKKLENIHHHFSAVGRADQADLVVKSKFRGIDPWIMVGPKCLRLTEIDDNLAEEYEKVKQTLKRGWTVKILSK